MSFLSGIPQLASLVAQPAVLAAGVAAGVAVGAVGVGTGTIPVTDPPPHKTVLYECPGSGRIVTSIAPNQNVLVTARSADGQWLQIYVGAAGVERGWAPASSLQLEAAPDGLPIEDCTPTATEAPAPTSVGSPSVLPSDSAAPSGTTPAPSVTASATPKPTGTPKPTATPAPTPTPYTGPFPYVRNLLLTGAAPDPDTGGYLIYAQGCDPLPIEATVMVEASDPDGIGAVLLWVRPALGSWSSSYMTHGNGDLWTGIITSPGTWADGPIEWYVEAWDSVEDNERLDPTSQQVLALAYCSD